MEEKVFRQFASAICGMYDIVYEVDMYQDVIYTWKRYSNEINIPEEGKKFREYAAEICGQYVHPGHRAETLKWMETESILSDFENGVSVRELEIPFKREEEFYRWFLLQMQLIEHTEDSLRVMIMVKNVHTKRQEEIKRQQVIMESLQLMRAVDSAFDMLISANLTQNSYYMIGYDRFINHTAPDYGNFDKLIEIGAATIPEHHREQFIETFSREKLLEAYSKGRKSVFLNHQQYADDGQVHWVSTHVMFMENIYNDDVLEITLSRCIDKDKEEEEKNKKLLQDALSLAEQANHAKTDFLSRMSHDIRTPMNAIIGMTLLAEANIEDRQKVRECLTKIEISSQYLLSLINDILDLSRIESGKLMVSADVFDFPNMIEGIAAIISSQASEKSQTFTYEIPENIERFYVGDELRIRQIFMNLLNNAHKYTGEGGAFSLSVETVKISEAWTQFRFQVKDNGIGIRQELLEKIFDPFFQEVHSDQRSGSGLGLAITQNLVHLMNGSVYVESEYQKGSCFTVEIPLKRIGQTDARQEFEEKNPMFHSADLSQDGKELSAEQEMQPGHREFASTQFSGEKILLVEDNELNQEIAASILEMKNLKVEIACNGKEGVEKFNASKPGEYALILMDIQMPVMNGYEASKAIRGLEHEDAKKIPIYAMTADAFAGDVAKAMANGMNGHFSKPVDFDKLSVVLREELKK